MDTQFGNEGKQSKNFFAKLSDPAIHGRYVGISPLNAMRGCSLAECKVGFEVDANGIRLDSAVECADGPVPFVISFPASWIFHMRNWGVYHCLSIRQNAESKLAQLVIDFTKVKAEGFEVDANMTLGEGMPAHLGVFFRQEKVDHDEGLLERLYDFCRSAAGLEDEMLAEEMKAPAVSSYLLPLDSVQAALIMATGDEAKRVETLNAAAHNLWTGDEAEIECRLRIIALGLIDSSPAVQKKALSSFVIGGRVVGGVEMVSRFLGQDIILMNCDVLSEAVHAAVCLLYEACRHNRRVSYLIKEFGAIDPLRIRESCSGMVTPEQFEAIEGAARISPQRRFSFAHQLSLRAALEKVSHRLENSERHQAILDRCLRGLADHPMP